MHSQVLQAALPQRWGVRQRCKNALIYWGARALAQLWIALPVAVAQWLARAVGVLAHRLARRERALAVAQLQRAFPDQSPAICEGWARRMFVHFGLCIAELAHVERWLTTPDAMVFEEGTRAVLDAALAQGRGVVLVAGHIGNWELMAQALVRAGYPLCTIAKPLYDPRLTRWVHAERVRHGMDVIWRGDADSGRRIADVFAKQRMLAVLIDQDTTRDTTFVPFFGRPAATPTGAAALALRFEAPVIVIWSHRVASATSGKTQHRIACRRLAEVPNFGRHSSAEERQDAVAALTEHMCTVLEQAIRAMPYQWVWLHRRWRRQPIVP